jgi:hypothetical protein
MSILMEECCDTMVQHTELKISEPGSDGVIEMKGYVSTYIFNGLQINELTKLNDLFLVIGEHTH